MVYKMLLYFNRMPCNPWYGRNTQRERVVNQTDNSSLIFSRKTSHSRWLASSYQQSMQPQNRISRMWPRISSSTILNPIWYNEVNSLTILCGRRTTSSLQWRDCGDRPITQLFLTTNDAILTKTWKLTDLYENQGY